MMEYDGEENDDDDDDDDEGQIDNQGAELLVAQELKNNFVSVMLHHLYFDNHTQHTKAFLQVRRTAELYNNK